MEIPVDDDDFTKHEELDQPTELYQTIPASNREEGIITPISSKDQRSHSHTLVNGSSQDMAFQATSTSSFLFQSKMNPFNITLGSTLHVERMI